nr:MAG TPA: hypothetical protein [Caudoviricetes sp.]
MKLAMDSAMTLRWHDEDGRMHVDRSNLTRVQVAPYYGSEIPGWEELKLDPEKVYYGYRPAEELGKEETIRSVQGIPIQLGHHLDYPDKPAKETRVGSTGDLAKFDGTYLSNSLHIQDEDAINRIRDGSMRQLSLAYHYIPDFNSSGEYEGQHYDFTMRRIRGQHLALVEEGRAGKTCVVEDHAFQGEKSMNDSKNPLLKDTGEDGSPAVEHAEVKIADAMGMLAELLRGLHKQGAMGETVDITEDEEKNAKIAQIAEAFKKLGAEDDAIEQLKGSLAELAAGKPEPQDEPKDNPDQADDADDVDDGDQDPPQDGDQGDQPDNGDDKDDFELDDFAKDALKACGFDDESPEFQRAFAEGVRYGEKKEKDEPKKLDSLHESEGEEKALAAQDAAIKRFEQKMDAIEDCAPILGRVRASAFDSAGHVYLAALKQQGVSIKGIKPEMAQAVFMGYTRGKQTAKKEDVAQDSKQSTQESDLLKNIKVRL